MAHELVSKCLPGLLIASALAFCACAWSTPNRPHPGLHSIWEGFEDLPEHRGLAIAGDPDNVWVGAAIGGQASKEDAEREALAECDKRRVRKRMRMPCRMYAIDGDVVWKAW